MSEPHIPTAVDVIADTYLDDWAALDPSMATYFGLAGHDDRLPEMTPDWYQARSDLRRRALTALAAAAPVDTNDRITIAAMQEQLGVEEELRAAGVEESDLKNIASPLQIIRDTFDLTPSATVADWEGVAKRLAAVPAALQGYMSSLEHAARRGSVRPVRQVRAGIEQSRDNVGPEGFFQSYARDAKTADGSELPESLSSDLNRVAVAASDAYDRLAEFLENDLLPHAPERDAVGRDLYQIYSRSFLGSRVDLDETYQWGQDELARITEQIAETSGRIKDGASFAEALQFLDSDHSRRLQGTDALREWMQRKSDEAVAALADTHFDIPAEIRRLDCRIAPTQQGGIYYTGPSEDLVTRPGTMWWSVPKGVTEFNTWRELTTVYHEGVPGHHLQVAQTIYRSNLLNRWRRIASWVSGHGEGWALYAERLMADLGFLDDPADFLGMLDAQSLRAARVVIDIGVHCDLPAPAAVGGGSWTYDKAWAFLDEHCKMNAGFRRFELDRYLGWPGQAPAYKIGERLWLQLREDARAKAGEAFDLKQFHRSALDIGSVGLDVLHSAVLGEFD